MKSPLLRKPRVLVVDDKRANLIALEAVLGDEYDVQFADSGPRAIELLRKDAHVDVVLMDVQMPVMDGFEAAAEIKKLEDCRDIPIIFVSAVYTDHPYIKKGYKSGGIDYFSKPFDPEILKMKLAVYASFRLKADLLKEKEHHVRESEELLRVGRKLSSLLESLPVGVLIADVEGRIGQSTEEVSRILKAVEHVEDDAYGEVLGWWDGAGRMIKNERGPLARALRGETSQSEPLEIECFDGSAKAVLVSASPLHSRNRQIVGAVVLIQDLTEPKRIEADLQQRVARLIGVGVEIEESVAR